MPMPRPETCVTRVAVERPGSKMQAMSWRRWAARRRRSCPSRPPSRALVEVEAGAVVGQLDGDFVGDLAHGQRDFAGLRLAGLRPRARGSMPWSSALRNRCSSGPTSFSSTARSSSVCPPRISRFARLPSSLRRPAHDPVQPLGQAAERHGANREQLLLHAARKPALRDQRRVGDLQVLQQRLLDGRDVIDPFGERARELLEARVLVELERIEAFLALAHLHQARLDLRLGLDLDFAHLRAQAHHAAGEFEQVRLQRAQLALDPRPRDRHFASLVDEAVDDVGAHAQHRAGAGFARRSRGTARGARPAPAATRRPSVPRAAVAGAAPGAPARRRRLARPPAATSIASAARPAGRWSCPRATRRERRQCGRGPRRASRTAPACRTRARRR